MKERPILFSGPMVRAILEGRKTQTRRLVKLPEESAGWRFSMLERGSDTNAPPFRCSAIFVRGATNIGVSVRCPYADGAAWSRLWVKETWGRVTGNGVRIVYRADGEQPMGLDGQPVAGKMTWVPSIHMSRDKSRLTLEVTNLRVERLQDITPQDILAEGVVSGPHHDTILGKCPVSAFDGRAYPDLRSLWASGWDSINGEKAPWRSNPWVWVVGFKPLQT